MDAGIEILSSLTCDQLKKLLKSRGLKVGGKKVELIERLLDYQGFQRQRDCKGQRGGGKEKNMFARLVEKSIAMNEDPAARVGELSERAKLAGRRKGDKSILDSDVSLFESTNPVAPAQHSWWHHHAPMYQKFGDYLCVKRSTLREMGGLLTEAFAKDT